MSLLPPNGPTRYLSDDYRKAFVRVAWYAQRRQQRYERWIASLGPYVEPLAIRRSYLYGRWLQHAFFGAQIPGPKNMKGNGMHYRNGREAKNGDKIVKLGDVFNPDGTSKGGVVVAFGVLHSATPGNDYCNGGIAPLTNDQGACMCDCLHVDDLAAILAEKGLDKRPAGK